MSLHYVQSESLTSGVTFSDWCDGMRNVSTLLLEAISYLLVMDRLHQALRQCTAVSAVAVEAVARCGVKGKWCEMVNRTEVCF